MSRLLGLVTIGQSPRRDIVPGMLGCLGPGVTVREAGALDGLDRDGIAALAPVPGDYVLASRMADGSPVTVARRHVVPRVQAAVARLEDQGCEVTALLCTGTFPDLETRRPFIEPQRLFGSACAALAGRHRLGVLIPLPEQVPQAEARWRELGLEARVRPASPYGPPGPVAAAARSLREAGVALVALDCFGFTEELRQIVRREARCPVIMANTYLARVLGELLS